MKDTPIKYGIYEKNISIQHIGSMIAHKHIKNLHGIHKPLFVSNIGDVEYYKSTHILLEIVTILKHNNYILKIYGKYEKEFKEDILKGK